MYNGSDALFRPKLIPDFRPDLFFPEPGLDFLGRLL